MSLQKEIILVTEPLVSHPLEWLRGECDVIEAASASKRFADYSLKAKGLVVRTYTRVDESLLARLPNLRVVGRAGVGVDNIDLAACKARGVAVVHTPDANTQAVVEYVVCLLADALRPRTLLNHAVALEAWESLRAGTAPARQMSETTVGILGFGRIGRRVAQVAGSIGFRVLFNDLLPIDPRVCSGAKAVDLATLAAESDVLTLHIDGRSANRNFVNNALIDSLRDDVTILNTCRGMVIDPSALASFLRAHPRARAILDVHEPEPFTSDYPLLGLHNAMLAPHLASRTETAMTNMSWVVRDVVEVLRGRAAKHQVEH
ncbi:MAG: 3-phosphoglycerate dehydrogenase [Phycisphaerales bacterium]|nr:3-phosphoglycerate dehydrogenase [Phycisphaerales bacterium]